MEVTSKLNDPFSYSLIPILICLIIILIIIAIYIICKHKTPKIKQQVIIPATKDINKIKNKYLEEINKLLANLNSKTISNRKCYQQLSLLIRNFIYEMTNIKVQNYTLKDIESLNIPILYELVSEYYDPEFAIISTGNIIDSINKTKGVIEKWK